MGDGTIALSVPLPVPVAGEISFQLVAPGFLHTCGLGSAGTAYCWGSNVFGQLGDGTTAGEVYNRLVPGVVPSGQRWQTLTAGWEYTCGLTEDGAAYCWGRNHLGQLGDGTTTNRLEPTPVSGGLRFTQIDAGEVHTCALALDETVYCWGGNSLSGKLGDGTTTDRLGPVAVLGP